MTTSSWDVADEESFFFMQDNDENETKKRNLQRKKQHQKNATEWVANEEASSTKPNVKDFTNIDGNTTCHSMDGIEANARKRVENDINPVL